MSLLPSLAAPLGVVPSPGTRAKAFSVVNDSGFVGTPGAAGSEVVHFGYTTTPGNYLLCVLAGDNAGAANGAFGLTTTLDYLEPTNMSVGSVLPATLGLTATGAPIDVCRGTGGGNQVDLLFGIAEIEQPINQGTLINYDDGIVAVLEVTGLLGAPLGWAFNNAAGTATPTLSSNPVVFYNQRLAIVFGMIACRTSGGGSLAQPPVGQGWTQILYQSGSGGFIGVWIGYQAVPAKTSGGLLLSAPGSTVPANCSWAVLAHAIT